MPPLSSSLLSSVSDAPQACGHKPLPSITPLMALHSAGWCITGRRVQHSGFVCRPEILSVCDSSTQALQLVYLHACGSCTSTESSPEVQLQSSSGRPLPPAWSRLLQFSGRHSHAPLGRSPIATCPSCSRQHMQRHRPGPCWSRRQPRERVVWAGAGFASTSSSAAAHRQVLDAVDCLGSTYRASGCSTGA